jgi:hypothetical protein
VISRGTVSKCYILGCDYDLYVFNKSILVIRNPQVISGATRTRHKKITETGLEARDVFATHVLSGNDIEGFAAVDIEIVVFWVY